MELDLACFEVVTAGSRGHRRQPGRHHQPLAAHAGGRRTSRPRGSSRSWPATELSPGRVIVELTEREAITDLDRLRRNVAGLQHAGVRIAADDVGAGNAGLRLLSQLRFDIVKIDLSLVQEGAQHDSSRNVLRSLKDLADRQGAVAIAEGLETAEQLRALRELGIADRPGLPAGAARPQRGPGTASISRRSPPARSSLVPPSPRGHRIAARPDTKRCRAVPPAPDP